MVDKLEVLKRPGKSAADFFAKKDQVRILASDVRIWFRSAGTPRLTVPTVETCERVAARINQILEYGSPIAHPVPSEVSRYFKLGLTHLKRARDAVAALGATDGAMSLWDAQIAAAETALQPFIFNAASLGAGEQFCQSVAAVARLAWQSAGREPRDLGPASPLVKFTVAAADGCGFSYKAETVSAWLRRG